jgi:hypothetical protein
MTVTTRRPHQKPPLTCTILAARNHAHYGSPRVSSSTTLVPRIPAPRLVRAGGTAP